MDGQGNFDYHPSAGGAVEQPKARTGVVSWTASEYIDHNQGAGWFLMLCVATVALAVISYFVTKSIFAAIIIVLAGVIVGAFASFKPKQLAYELSDRGLKIQEKLYPFSNFKSFSVITEGQFDSIELTPIKRFMPSVSVFFARQDEEQILNVLSNFLPYEDRQLDNVERLARRLRF